MNILLQPAIHILLKTSQVNTRWYSYGIVAMLWIVALPSAAQVRIEKKTFRFGVDLAQTTAPLNALGDEQLKPVFSVGYGADLRLTTNAHVHFGLRYSPRGNRYRIDYTDSTYLKTNLALRYIDVPVALVLTAGKPNARLKPYLSAGVYTGVGVSGKEKREGNTVGRVSKRADSTYTQATKVFGKSISRFDVGYNLEIGFQTRMVQFGIHHGQSFNDLRLTPGEAIRNRTWGVFLNVLFDDVF